MNCLIVDDEPLARSVLEQYVGKTPFLKSYKSCGDVLEAIGILDTEPIDVLFLDIHMPEITGIEFIKMRSFEIPVIITTAHPDYAVQGYELNILDYLLKPISFDRFLKAATKAKEMWEQSRPSVGEPENEIFVRTERKLQKINLKDVLYVEALADYVRIQYNNEKVTVLNTMKYMEERLPADQFTRVHRSYIVRIDKIKFIEEDMIVMEQKLIPIGKSYRDNLMSRLNML